MIVFYKRYSGNASPFELLKKIFFINDYKVVGSVLKSINLNLVNICGSLRTDSPKSLWQTWGNLPCPSYLHSGTVNIWTLNFSNELQQWFKSDQVEFRDNMVQQGTHRKSMYLSHLRYKLLAIGGLKSKLCLYWNKSWLTSDA